MSDLERLLDLQRCLTTLEQEVMRFYEFVINKKNGNDITIILFENEFLNDAFEIIRKHATWNKDGKEV